MLKQTNVLSSRSKVLLDKR